jgi:hypothetical protein
MRQRYLILFIFTVVIVGGTALYLNDFEYALLPKKEDIMVYKVNNQKGFDIWGKFVKANPDGIRALSAKSKQYDLSSEAGAVKVDDSVLKLGREVFYKETFGNEVFLTDVMGVIDGPLTIGGFSKALLQLKGEGTTNLRVELAEDVTIGDRNYKKGEKIDTGIDVPKGSLAPLGMPVTWEGRKVRVGISCAACHATVDPDTKKVIEDAPNNDLNTGLIIYRMRLIQIFDINLIVKSSHPSFLHLWILHQVLQESTS